MAKKAEINKRRDKKINPELKGIIILEAVIFLLYLIISLIVCTVLYLSDIQTDIYYYIILAALALTSFVSGYITGKKMKKNGLVNGVLYNIFIVIIIILTSLILNGFTFDYRLFLTLGLMIVMSAIGGISAVNTRRKSR